MKSPATVSGIPRLLLRDVQVLAIISISFSLLGGTLQEIHRIVGASGIDVVVTQVLSNLFVSAGTIAAGVLYLALRCGYWPLGRAWRAEHPIPLWALALGGAAGGAVAALVLRAGEAGWLIASSALWMVIAGFLVRVICSGARRVELQAIELTRTADELQMSRMQLMQASGDMREAVAERLHGPIQGQLIGIEHDLRHDGSGDLADRLRDFRVGTIRSIAHQLHPMLLDVGLLPALDELITQSPLDASLEASPAITAIDDLGVGALSAQVRRAAYTIIEQALLNAATAGQASTVQVRLDVQDGALEMTISDDGIGVNEPVQRGLGLRAIDAWTGGLGGTWQLRARVSGGSDLHAVLPLETTSS